MSRQCIMACGLFIALGVLVAGSRGSNIESCPIGWVTYDKEVPNTCLYVSDGTTDTLSKAQQACVTKDASLIVIQTEKKLNYFKEMVRKFLNGGDTKIWMGLEKFSDGFKWLTPDGYTIKANDFYTLFSSRRYEHYHENNDDGWIYKQGILYEYHQLRYDRNSRYICEKRSTCKKGWFGLGCDKECHCHGQECAPNAEELTCDYGCKVGWMGDDCSRPKEDADVTYFCVNSADLGKYVHVRMDTKGVHYDNIHAVDEDGDSMAWCNNTAIHTNRRLSTVAIKIHVDNSTDEAMAEGNCSGKVTDEGKYEWRIKIQELEGIVSRNDQEVLIECDFANADTFRLSGNTEIERERWFRRSDIKKPIEYLKEKKEKVELKVVDPSTGKSVSEAQIGSPVVLRIKFGQEEGSLVTGVQPYNCDASSSDREHSTRFLDYQGCQLEGFPISGFQRNGTHLTTNVFSLFGFDQTEQVDFHCSYTLCFGDDPCLLGCDMDSPQQNTTRSRRSAGIKPWTAMATVVLTSD